ncbi:glycoside hydrolase family 30 protein [Sphaerobolus stellatus SS14]|nr:glycoside hydrolase family 30 protein [Sphaerobolus stellatus SS14]
MSAAETSFAGVAFHCYAGNVKNQTLFHNAFPEKEVYHTECAGVFSTSDWWSNIKWYMDNLFIGAPENWARTVMMWNHALDGQGNSLLPGTKICGGGYRVATISSGSFDMNEEYYALAHASRVVIP